MPHSPNFVQISQCIFCMYNVVILIKFYIICLHITEYMCMISFVLMGNSICISIKVKMTKQS